VHHNKVSLLAGLLVLLATKIKLTLYLLYIDFIAAHYTACVQVAGAAASDVPEGVRLQGATPLRRVQSALGCGASHLDDAAVAHAIADILKPAVCTSTTSSGTGSSSGTTSSSSGTSSSAELKRFAAHFVLQARRQFPECMQESAASGDAEDKEMRKDARKAADDILCSYIDHLRYCTIVTVMSMQTLLFLEFF
jgi:hypothetical protein